MDAENPGTDPVARLAETVRADVAKSTRKARTAAVLIALLNLFVIGYMTWIRSSLAQLDAGEITSIAARSVESEMPGLAKQAGDFLVGEAPAATDRARDLLLEAPAALRAQMEAVLDEKIRTEVAALEETLDAKLEEALQSKLAELRESYPVGSDEAKLHALLDEMLEEYSIRMESMLSSMYEGFAREARRLGEKFERLRTAGDLDDRELIQKEILQAWVVLVEKHGITGVGK